MNRFLQSANSFFPLPNQQRPSTTGKVQRLRLSSTGQTFIPNNTISNFRPQSSARSTSSSSFRNTKGKLETLGDHLATLLSSVKDARSGCRDIQLHLDFAKEELNQRGIDPIRISLMQEIRLLDKAAQIRKRSDMLRFQALHATCHALGKNSKEIKGRMVALGERLREMEVLLGYNGVRNGLKY